MQFNTVRWEIAKWSIPEIGSGLVKYLRCIGGKMKRFIKSSIKGSEYLCAVIAYIKVDTEFVSYFIM